MISSVPAGMIVGLLLERYFQPLANPVATKQQQEEDYPTSEEWYAISHTILNKVDYKSIKSKAFSQFCQSTMGNPKLNMARYMTLYLLPNHAIYFKEYWPKINNQDMIDHDLEANKNAFLQRHPAIDRTVLDHVTTQLANSSVAPYAS